MKLERVLLKRQKVMQQTPTPPQHHLCSPYLDWEDDKPMAEPARQSPHTQAHTRHWKKEGERAAGSFDT